MCGLVGEFDADIDLAKGHFLRADVWLADPCALSGLCHQVRETPEFSMHFNAAAKEHIREPKMIAPTSRSLQKLRKQIR